MAHWKQKDLSVVVYSLVTCTLYHLIQLEVYSLMMKLTGMETPPQIKHCVSYMVAAG